MMIEIKVEGKRMMTENKVEKKKKKNWDRRDWRDKLFTQNQHPKPKHILLEFFFLKERRKRIE